jgi:hypothetical protein
LYFSKLTLFYYFSSSSSSSSLIQAGGVPGGRGDVLSGVGLKEEA